MESLEALIGTAVRVKDGYRKPELEGMCGVIGGLWGGPNYTALNVRLDDGRSELFWFYQLDVVEAGAEPSTRIAFYDGS